MKNTLSLDASDKTLDFYSVYGSQKREERLDLTNNRLDELLAPALAKFLDGTTPDEICVGLGPASFTALRIILAYAKGLLKGDESRLFGVPSLESYAEYGAQELSESSSTSIPLFLNGKRGYYSSVSRGENGRLLSKMYLSADELIESIEAHSISHPVIICTEKTWTSVSSLLEGMDHVICDKNKAKLLLESTERYPYRTSIRSISPEYLSEVI